MNQQYLPMNPQQGPQWDHIPWQEEPEEQSPLTLVRQLLRGRLLVACVLALVLGALGATAGFLVAKPKWESKAVLRIAPILPKVLYESESNNLIPMFSSYVETQIALIRSSRVIEMAKQSATWQEATKSIPDHNGSFPELVVTAPPRTELLVIGAQSVNPVISQAASKALVDAYLTVFDESDLVKETQRLQLLQERSTDLSMQIERLRNNILGIAHEFGTDDLEDIHAFQLAELQNYDTELKAAKLDLAIAESGAGGEVGSAEATRAVELSIDDIASMDARMQHLLSQYENQELKLSEIELVYKNPERRADYQLLQQHMEFLQTKIDEHAESFREKYVPRLMAQEGETGVVAARLDPEHARLKVDRLQKLYDETREETLALGRKSLEIENLRAQMTRAQDALHDTNARIEELSVESSVGGRVSVLSEPEIPSEPVNAHRIRQTGIMGGLAGGGLGLALVALIGLVNPRVRFISDAEAVRPALLGALPELPSEVTDPAEAMIAVQCVHQIRTVLQTNAQTRDAQVLTITSAASGTGKTSLALSLALSYASSGTRTLLIDGDSVGRGLTRRTGVALRPKLSRVLRECGVISEEQARKALDHSRQSKKLIGKTLLELGYIDDQQLDDALALQRECSAGLFDALNGENIEDCTVDIGVSNLSILPASHWNDSAMEMVSRRAMGDLVGRLKDLYEMVIIDAGPVPGPTDSSIMAASADGVLMIVSRGETQPDIRRTLHHLDLIYAPLLGMVFNRAMIDDLNNSSHSSSASSVGTSYEEVRLADQSKVFAKRDLYARYGSLAQSVRLFTSPAVARDNKLDPKLLHSKN